MLEKLYTADDGTEGWLETPSKETLAAHDKAQSAANTKMDQEILEREALLRESESGHETVNTLPGDSKPEKPDQPGTEELIKSLRDALE